MGEESKREHITEAALKLFSEKGYHQTTVTEIAKQADVAKGTVYWYFESKKDLFRGILISGIKEMNQNIKNKIKGDFSPSEKIEQIIFLYLKFFANSKEMSKMYEENSSGIDPEFKKQLVSLRQEAVDLIGQVVKEGQQTGDFTEKVDYQEAASLLLGMISVYNPHFCEDNELNLGKVETIKDLFLHGLFS